MGRWLRHRWVIVGAAFVLVLAIGAVSWAATGSSSTTTPPASGQPGPGPGFGMGGRGFGHGKDGAQGMDQGQFKQQRQARLDAVLKLVREKMSPADQAKLDQLLAQEKTQQAALQKARQDLKQTTTDLRSLVDKYLGVTTPTTGTTPTTQPAG
jgi:hypothetical protein